MKRMLLACVILVASATTQAIAGTIESTSIVAGPSVNCRVSNLTSLPILVAEVQYTYSCSVYGNLQTYTSLDIR